MIPVKVFLDFSGFRGFQGISKRSIEVSGGCGRVQRGVKAYQDVSGGFIGVLKSDSVKLTD